MNPRAARTCLVGVSLLNLAALGLGLGSLLLGGKTGQGSIGGAAFLLVLILNPASIAFVALVPWPAGKTAVGKDWRHLATAYLAVAIPALFGMMAGNFVLSSRYEEISGVTLASGAAVYGGFAAICLLGAWVTVAARRAWRPGGAPPEEGEHRPLGCLGAALGIAGSLAVLGFAAFLAGLLLFGGRAGHPLSWFAIPGAPFGPFWGGIAVHAGVLSALLLSSCRGGRPRRSAAGVLSGLGALVLVIQLLPLVSLPVYLRQSHRAFEALAGAGQQRLSPIPAGFKRRPFSLTGYFLGIPRQGCEIRRDVRFFEGREGLLPEERDLRLHFDAFLPPPTPGNPSRSRPVLIRIHGGGWRLGDKGLGNMMQMNRHFAAQGYAVFDVQYGLKGDPGRPPVVTPPYLLGAFDLDDMMRHLGYFVRYLKEHAEEYGADLATVFVSGGSAGGQLACALALALAGGQEPELLGTGVTVQGLVPFYPANGVPASWIAGEERWRNPELLVEADSPPCLVFQGNQDGMVAPETSRRLCRAYREAGNPACTVLGFPFAPHAADIYYSGYYNQVFLYFMERFLYELR